MADIPRLRKVLDHIKSIPKATTESIREIWLGGGTSLELWNQADWMYTSGNGAVLTERGLVNDVGAKCGTACCFAGFAVIMFGETGTRLSGASAYFPNGNVLTVREYAEQLLELTPSEGSHLFAAVNTLEQIEEQVERLAEADERLNV